MYFHTVFGDLTLSVVFVKPVEPEVVSVCGSNFKEVKHLSYVYRKGNNLLAKTLEDSDEAIAEISPSRGSCLVTSGLSARIWEVFFGWYMPKEGNIM